METSLKRGDGDGQARNEVKKARLASSLVKVGGKKLRAGTVPWKIADNGTDCAEVLLIECLGAPGFWTFPAGSLDPGEEVSSAAARETKEECGASGSLGCFLGTFETDKNRSYVFALQVQSVQNEDNEAWHDVGSAYSVTTGRRRRWFRPEAARLVLHKEGPRVLEAFLSVPPGMWHDQRFKVQHAKPQGPRLLLLGTRDQLTVLQEHCSRSAEILDTSWVMSSSDMTDAQVFAAVTAAVWEADAVVCVGELFGAALSACRSVPTLVLTDVATCRLCRGDARISLYVLEAKSERTFGEEACRRLDDFIKQLPKQGHHAPGVG
mmetsp:Transcript_54073/g.126260  ORF Transcript_54073/g.126260 Transcript_54073/m.126260 type:complete len:322 (-) Transcript_54073:131-1096(-)